MGKVTGGKALYGAAVGILMLEARFARIPGGMGNALTWPFPVLYKVVRDATPHRAVRQRAEGLLNAGIGAAAGLPVYSMYNFATWFQSALAPRRVPPHRGQSMKGGIDPYESPSRGRGLSFPGLAA